MDELNVTTLTTNSSFQNYKPHSNKYLDEKILNENFAKFECCRKNCKETTNPYDTKALRNVFHNKTQAEQRQFMLDYINQFVPDKVIYLIRQTPVCKKFWCFTHGTSVARLTIMIKGALTKGWRNGAGLHQGKQITPKGLEVQRWIIQYANLNGGRPPDTDKYYLPSCVTKEHLFEDFLEECEFKVDRSTFYRIWKDHCSHIIIPENTRFTKCELCSKIRDLRQKASEKDWKIKYKELRIAHTKKQNAERSKYYHHRKKARKNPEKYGSIIIDGMDQQKTYLPHFKTKFKNMPNDLLKVHVSGAISHGTQEVFMFLNGGQWSGDSNLTCNIITEVLLRMTKDKNTLPPVLYIQLDNCWSENKNQFVMAFCALLVGWRLVDKVRLSFLMVGHTHEDIDQTFSNISGSLKTNDAKTMSSLVKVIEGTFKRKPTVVVNEHMDDYKTMLGPHIFEPSGHTGPHAFKFEWKNEKVVMSSKEWSASGDWSEVGELLDVDGVVNAIQINPPSFAKICLAKIKSVANSKKTEQVMTKEEREEWTRFVEKSIQKEKMYQHPSLDLSKSKGPCSLSELGTQSPKERKRNSDEEARFSQLMEKHNKKISKVYLDRRKTGDKPPTKPREKKQKVKT